MFRTIHGAAQRMICVFALALLALVQTAAGQLSSALSAASPIVYRLNPDATFERGCFPPCLCPVWFGGPVRGTMLLTPIPSTSANTFDYRVDEVNWLAATGNIEWRITGSGMLRRTGGPGIASQRLELDLKVGDDPIQHFDSGWVVPDANFPHLRLAVSVNGGYCFDTVINVNASPVPRVQVLNYRLLADSQYITGCYPPCLCPISLRVLGGTLTLVPMLSLSTTPAGPIEYAVASARLTAQNLNAPSPSPSIARLTYRGSGFYRRNLPNTSANSINGQRMFLDLRSSNALAPQHFDSGVAAQTVAWPAIDIALSMNGMVCYDTVFQIHAVNANTAP